LAALQLGGFAACPAELRGAKYFFFSRKAPKKSWSLGLPTGGLCGLAALRAFLFSFFLAKTQIPAYRRQAQRNYGQLGLTAEGLPVAVRKTFAA